MGRGEHWPWARAGERRDPVEREARRRAAVAKRNREQAKTLADNRVAYQRWRDGLVCPAAITLALDANGLHGPEVDIACQAREPEVDQWEAGERYPTWDQLLALAELTGHTPQFFTLDIAPVPVSETSMRFHMTAEQRRAWERQSDPVMRYPRAVLDARPPAPAEMPEPETLG